MDENLIDIAMEIILDAGDARTYATDAMRAELAGDQARADTLMKQAKDSIKKAHNAQTDVIQAEARGEHMQFSLLFMHAQDTVMTIISEVNMIELMMEMYRKQEDKLNGNRDSLS